MQTVSRLIEQFIPEHYDLSITLEREERTFHGTVTITGLSPSSSGSIIVHAKKLFIESATVDGKRADSTLGDNDELMIIHPDIHAGKHIIVIGFSGQIDDPMHGIYPCYFEHDGIKKEMLATQFESHHAREAFPCIDEPEAKATFAITLTTEKNITVLGNMPINAQRTESDRLITSFATTPRMSTYLVAWVAGELQRKTALTKDGVEVNVWSSPAQPAASLDFALTTAVELVEFFNDYFGVPYPLPKCDHVALPDFSVGAMENWGLITYREVALLADPATISTTNKRYIAMVIAHELSHQWFGNLVTMKWWNNLWLNESFANLMGYLAPATLHPDWSMWIDFITNTSTAALQRDSIDGVQPVQVAVHHPDEIGTLFDGAIMYAKGSRLINMLREYIGPDTFQAGLKIYFKTHAYSNTDEHDLWRAFSAASGEDIEHFMTPWISQPGYPVVHVTKQNDTITLSQERFFTGPHMPSDSSWPIPLSAHPPLTSLLSHRSQTVSMQSSYPELNRGNIGHFIAHYDQPLLESITRTIETMELPSADRLKILFEQILLARGSVISTSSLIPLLTHFSHEDSEHVWNTITLAINELTQFVEDNEPLEQRLRNLVGDLARSQYARLGWYMKPNESSADISLRAVIIGLMVYAQDKNAISTAQSLYASTPVDKLNPELRRFIINAATQDNHETALSVLSYYKKTSSAEIRKDIARALAATRNQTTVDHLLSCITNSDVIRKQDAIHWYAWLINNPKARRQTWQWLQQNWRWIERSYKSDLTYDYFPRHTANAFASASLRDEYISFFTPLQSQPALTRAIAMGISEIEGKVTRIERDKKAMEQALLKL